MRSRKRPACPPGPTRPCGLTERPSCSFCLLTSRLLCLHSGGRVFPQHPRDRSCSKANRPSAQILCIVNTTVRKERKHVGTRSTEILEGDDGSHPAQDVEGGVRDEMDPSERVLLRAGISWKAASSTCRKAQPLSR
ncbi:hypothetical protein MG293_002324 [Ovis ammon polii]|uniref:Uncharacterized protein n=1 Tax=Ovis ammon polii TaxID=230172 RepID=A0AAD4YF46_OVIAM|nr:hypothetical protein MG293_002324 [Ovis ammon polii]